MATLEEIIREKLLANAPFNAAIGGRLWRMQIPQKKTQFPCGAFFRVGTQRVYSHSSNADVGLSRWQFNFYDQSEHSGEVTSEIVLLFKAALETFNATQVPASPEVLYGNPNFIIDQREGMEPNTQPPVWFARLDVQIWFRDQ